MIAVDLEGSGAQDGEHEAILEIALVPLVHGHPSPADSYHTLINPGRPLPRRPWTSPGLTNEALKDAPPLEQIEPELTTRLADSTIVGHNVTVDWRLLRRRCPNVQPAALLDTLRLARICLPDGQRKGLQPLLEHYGLVQRVDELASDSQPHRALWDAFGAALLLFELIHSAPESLPLRTLYRSAVIPIEEDLTAQSGPEQLPLL
ncbi:3'-5' exonuclease [Bailinhaonella thermotolerans]|uniref:3'-5' exonuclease n=1 Tax=Bailinhaonella thermotolerans TaxID=1070861 RepID=UPI00192A4795|nr:3'-5' exonuclease [Bailinhaonella thermotolerans]